MNKNINVYDLGVLDYKTALNFQEKKLIQNPLTSKVGAISVGIVKGELIADLDYEKDSNAEVDLNLVLDEKFEIFSISKLLEDNL